MSRNFWRLAAAISMLAVWACHPDFQLKGFTTNEALYKASLAEYQRNHWDNAVTGFEKLTTDLPARDSLLPRSYWYLASSHEHQGEFLLAAQSYNRLVESFPDDSLADRAALQAARSYARLWRKPELSPEYGETALAAYNTLVGLYPTSKLIPTAQKEISDLENKFAQKDYIAGMYYFRKKAWDSGILYFKDVVTKYGTSPTARDAMLRLVESYKAIHYKEDESDMCTQLRQRYPRDGEVARVCAGVPNSKADSLPPSQQASKPPSPGTPPVR